MQYNICHNHQNGEVKKFSYSQIVYAGTESIFERKTWKIGKRQSLEEKLNIKLFGSTYIHRCKFHQFVLIVSATRTIRFKHAFRTNQLKKRIVSFLYHLNDIKKRLHIRNYSLDPIKSFLVVSLESSHPRFRFTLRETQRKDRSLVNLVTSSFSSFFVVKIPTNRKLGTAMSR